MDGCDLKVQVAEKVIAKNFDSVALLCVKTDEVEFFFNSERSFFSDTLKLQHKMPFNLSEIVTPLAFGEVKQAMSDISIESIVHALDSDVFYSRSFKLCDKNDDVYYKKIAFSYFDRDSGLVLVTCSDVTADKVIEDETEKKVKHAIGIAEHANNVKSEFLARMSHDIRTPLNGIIGMTEIALENTDRSDKVQHYLERIQYASQYLLSIVRDILDISRIDSGKLVVSSEPFQMHELVREVFALLQGEASLRHLDFTNRISDDLYFGFIGDPLHIMQILINLLNNSIKYTNQGGKVSLAVTCKGDIPEEGLCQVTFTVSDTGVGISEDFQKHMFEAFEQAHNSSGTYSTGAGLGLSIVQKLTTHMNGTITVNSQLGLGSTFSVTLPLIRQKVISPLMAIAGEPETPETPETLSKIGPSLPVGVNRTHTRLPVRFNGQRVLIVEDNEINMEIVRTILSSVNLCFDSAWNGQECVDMFSKSSVGYYAAILMDIRMPVMNGREATRRIRLMPRLDSKKLPIIALSADAFDEEVKASQSAGMDDYIIKPVNKGDLTAVLKQYIK